MPALTTSRTWAEISLEAIRHNFILSKQKSRAAKKYFAVVKSNAYGHGVIEVSKALSDIADGYAVATPEEAFELREAGISSPILILGFAIPEWSDEIVENDVIPAVYSLGSAENYSRSALKAGKKARIMLVLDTGMGRIGLECGNDGIKTVTEIAKLPGIEIYGIFSHLACADMTDGEEETKSQLAKFDKFCANVRALGIALPNRSILNSAGDARFGGDYEISRIGISTYGYSPSGEVSGLFDGLIPAMSVYTRISRVRTVPAGTGIGYGHTFVTDKETKVATLCCGYADGVPRLLSNHGSVIINGKKAPILGRVCMDQMMVDVSEIEDVKEGMKAVLLGRDGGEKITADDIAEIAQTISYEVLCGFDRKRMMKVFTGQ